MVSFAAGAVMAKSAGGAAMPNLICFYSFYQLATLKFKRKMQLFFPVLCSMHNCVT